MSVLHGLESENFVVSMKRGMLDAAENDGGDGNIDVIHIKEGNVSSFSSIINN